GSNGKCYFFRRRGFAVGLVSTGSASAGSASAVGVGVGVGAIAALILSTNWLTESDNSVMIESSPLSSTNLTLESSVRLLDCSTVKLLTVLMSLSFSAANCFAAVASG